MKHGANVSHVTRAPECNTALHEAVSRGHLQIAELLMRAGANPFLENGRQAFMLSFACSSCEVATQIYRCGLCWLISKESSCFNLQFLMLHEAGSLHRKAERLLLVN